MPRNRHKNLARAIAHRAEKKETIATGQLTVFKRVGTADVLAQLVIQLRDRKQQETGSSVCIPDVALFRAGHRSKPKNPFHAQK